VDLNFIVGAERAEKRVDVGGAVSGRCRKRSSGAEHGAGGRGAET